MIKRPWLLPITLPILVLWLVLRIARLPLNFGLILIAAAMDYVVLREKTLHWWPSWRMVWGWS